jgi:hypothetical protein
VPPPARPFSDERLLLDRRLEALRRMLPDGPNPAADVMVVREMAEGARLAQIGLEARAPVEAGARGDVPLDVVAQGGYAEIERFFRQVALSPRLVDVESLTLSATPENVIRLQAVLRLPYRPLRAPVPPAPESPRGRPANVAKPVADAYQRDQALAFAKSEAIVALRRARRNPRLFLAELSAAVRDRPVVLSHASLGDEFSVRGLVVGEGPVRALESRFERGLFRIAEFLVARQGACRRFEVRGRSPIAGPDAELPLPTEDPFEQDDAPCRVDRDPPRPIVVKAPALKPAAAGPLNLRLRDVDLTDVFRVLHLVTGQGFLVDGDVSGRVSLDFTRVGLEDALLALEKAAGIDVSEPGRLRRVASARLAPHPATPSAGGPSSSFSLKRIEVRELLAIMTDIDAGLAALGPAGTLGRVSLWAKDLPVADVRAAVLESAGLKERLEESRRLLEHGGSPPGEVLVPVAGTADSPRLVLRPQDLSSVEFELAGLVSDGGGWTALAYSPTGTLNAYRAGERLADGTVRSVDSTDVGLDTDEGLVRVPVTPLPK